MINQILVESADGTQIIDHGDSGSMLCFLDKKNNLVQIVGLIHSLMFHEDEQGNKQGFGMALVAAPIKPIFEKLNIEV